jgi:ABC-type glycerol-3-phosphate transport system substrate-binding protein
MKKFVKMVALLTVMLLALSACGQETFTCEWCGKTVTGTSHKMSVLGESLKLCDDCYADLKDAALGG